MNDTLHQCNDVLSKLQCNITARLLESGCSLNNKGLATRLQSHRSSSSPSVQCDCDCCFKPHDVCSMYYECTAVRCALYLCSPQVLSLSLPCGCFRFNGCFLASSFYRPSALQLL